MSVSFSNFVPLQCAHFWSFGETVSASSVYQASAPERANSAATFLFTLGSLSGLPQDSHKNTAMGTPHTRWREMHQSGRVAIMFDKRSSPHAGSHFPFLMSSIVRERSVPPPSMGVSMEMNHCSVARKMTGLWQRQQWGSECSNVPAWSNAPRFRSSSMMIGFALNTY